MELMLGTYHWSVALSLSSFSFHLFPTLSLSNPDIREEWMCDYNWGMNQSCIVMANISRESMCVGVCWGNGGGSESYQCSDEMRDAHTHTHTHRHTHTHNENKPLSLFSSQSFSGFKVTLATHTHSHFYRERELAGQQLLVCQNVWKGTFILHVQTHQGTCMRNTHTVF